ncbi:TPA: Component of a membrane-bound complex containing the Tor2p kinase [Trebouxia sp. C0005]
MRTSHLALPASQCEQFRKAFVSQTRASQRLCRAATGASFLPSRYAAIKSIDVEFAHFVNKGQITTAAAEVCLLAEDGSVLLNSYICPELHAASSGFDWIGGVTVENYTDAPTLKVIQQQLTTLLEGSLLIGYGLSKDLSSLRLHHPHALQKDLIRYRKFQSSTGQARKLQEISQRFLSHDIQAGKHTARYVPQLQELHECCIAMADRAVFYMYSYVLHFRTVLCKAVGAACIVSLCEHVRLD